MPSIIENIARNLRAKRKAKKWSQETAAEKCEMSVNSYGRNERGQANPTAKTMQKMCKGLDMTIEQLVAEPAEILTV